MDPFETRADNSPVMAPAGCAHMTIGDLARYGAAHLAGESEASPPLLPRLAWQRLHTPFRGDYASGWYATKATGSAGPVLWHNGSNTLWYALLILVRSLKMVLAFATNDGAIRRAEAAFGGLARELTASSQCRPSGIPSFFIRSQQNEPFLDRRFFLCKPLQSVARPGTILTHVHASETVKGRCPTDRETRSHELHNHVCTTVICIPNACYRWPMQPWVCWRVPLSRSTLWDVAWPKLWAR